MLKQERNLKRTRLAKGKKEHTNKQTNKQTHKLQQQQQQQAKTERKEQHIIIVNNNSSSDNTKHFDECHSPKHFDEYLKFGETHGPKTRRSAFFIYLLQHHDFLAFSPDGFRFIFLLRDCEIGLLFYIRREKRDIHPR